MTRNPDEPLFVVLPEQPIPDPYTVGIPQTAPAGAWSPDGEGPAEAPHPEEDPVGPPRRDRRRLAALGAIGGLIVAVGLVALLRPDSEPSNRADDGAAVITPAPRSSDRDSLDPTTDPGDPVTSAAPVSAADPVTSTGGVLEVPAEIPADVPAREVDFCGVPLSTITLPFRSIEEPTGARMLVGAAVEVDLDTGLLIQPLVEVAEGEMVSQLLRHDGITYVSVVNCESTTFRAVAIGPDGVAAPVRIPLAEAEQARGLIATDLGPITAVIDADLNTIGFQPLLGGGLIPVPETFIAISTEDSGLVGYVEDYETGESSMVAVDLATGVANTLTDLPRDSVVMTDDGQIIISADPSANSEGVSLSVLDLDTGETTTLDRLLPPGFRPWESSPDGRYLLGTTDSAALQAAGGGFEVTEPMTVAYGLFDLESGELLEVPSLQRVDQWGSALGIGFTGDGHRLVIAARTEAGTRLLTWQPGEEMLFGSPRMLPTTDDPWIAFLGLPDADERDDATGRR